MYFKPKMFPYTSPLPPPPSPPALIKKELSFSPRWPLWTGLIAIYKKTISR